MKRERVTNFVSRGAASLGILLLVFTFAWSGLHSQVKLGNEVLVEKHLDMVKGKQVGLIVNHTARFSSGEFLVDALIANGVNVVALFGPEHGIRGEAAAGEKISDEQDEKTGIPVFSLYGKNRKPTSDMLTNVDILVYDIQDVGARFYTYITTMGFCMEAAAEKGIPFVVLDRPNPLGGVKVDGPVMEDSLRSFVGMYPIPVVYGLTCGELAMMINEEGWLEDKKKCDLTVIPVEGWKREMLWGDTGLSWIPPSPNIKTPEVALVYPATCFVEATNVSEGRGTEKPFQYIGAPFIDGDVLASNLDKSGLPGVKFSPVSFTPTASKLSGESCHGVFVEVVDPKKVDAVRTGLTIINQIQKLYPSHLKINQTSFLKLMGSVEVYGALLSGSISSGSDGIREFSRLRSSYHLYK